MPREGAIEQFTRKAQRIEILPQQIAVLDEAGRIIAVNAAWETHGWKGEGQSAVGIDYAELFSANLDPEKAKETTAGIKSVLSGKSEFKTEFGPRQHHLFLIQASSIAPAQGVSARAVVSLIDITRNREIERERARLLVEARDARESAEAANRGKVEFLAQITHDLRAPLSAILGWIRILRTRSLDKNTEAEALAVIEQSAEKQKLLIDDILDLSRIVDGKLRLNVKAVSLGTVIRSSMEVMRPACDAKEIECEIDLSTEADTISGDPGRLEQVIWNLVSNAVKFTPHKGKIEVRLERADPFLRISVIDTGKGIKQEHLRYVFQRNWQQSDETGGVTGLGLGLSLVKHIVELHGGSVEVYSPGEGKGSTFVVNLPYRAVGMQSSELELRSIPAVTKLESPRALAGVRIVVVDDEADARDLVATVFEQEGAQVFTASSAQEALGIVSELRPLPDLIVSDISMPVDDGYSLIVKIRKLSSEEGGRIPAIALTAFGRVEDRIRALNAGFQMHLAKPVEPAELVLVAANLAKREGAEL